MTTTRPHTNRDDVSELDRLREEYRNWWSATEGWTRLEGAQKADALITALEAENERLTGILAIVVTQEMEKQGVANPSPDAVLECIAIMARMVDEWCATPRPTEGSEP